MNTKLLRKIQQHILEEPRRLDMLIYRHRIPKRAIRQGDPPCGTVACIAGWAIEFTAPRTRLDAASYFRGRDALALTDEQAGRLFYSSEWPEPFRGQYAAALDAQGRAAVTAELISHFIKTEGAE